MTGAPRRELSLAHLTVLDATPPELVTVAAPGMPTEPPDLIREARTGRLLPGEGVLPLADLVRALPASATLAVEAPVLATAGLPLLERAQRAHRAMRQLLDNT